MDRTTFHVTPYVNGWQVKAEKSDQQDVVVDTKERAVELARELAHQTVPSQVIVHNKDGKISDEFTYGDDPRNIPG